MNNNQEVTNITNIDKNNPYKIEHLSGDFNRGYTKAIQDITEIFEYIQPDLKHHKKNLTGKLSIQLLKCILDNREKIRDNWLWFIRWNGVKNCFECVPEKIRK